MTKTLRPAVILLPRDYGYKCRALFSQRTTNKYRMINRRHRGILVDSAVVVSHRVRMTRSLNSNFRLGCLCARARAQHLDITGNLLTRSHAPGSRRRSSSCNPSYMCLCRTSGSSTTSPRRRCPLSPPTSEKCWIARQDVRMYRSLRRHRGGGRR